ncbi:M23 family metallopeptidase [Arthrobacter sp. 260]|uniref:M23 family metallopeptidase n=1 Tax=Arthrobacter sp. 260 TaxID=2735314 RepID=UPI003209A214
MDGQRLAIPDQTQRPRDARRDERRRRASRSADGGTLARIGQKLAISAAVSGLALTVTLPTTAATQPIAVPAPTSVSVLPSGEVHADSGGIRAPSTAPVDFSRTALRSTFDPEAKLSEILTAGDGGVPTAAKGSLSLPVKDVEISSPFGNRISPITGIGGEHHSGQDFSSPCGSAVLAAASGTVTFVGWHGFGGGNRVVIDHGNGLESSYNHLAVSSVEEGESVDRGQTVAQTGSTGASTGCHLHFEVLVDGDPVDPMGWL